MLSRRLLVFSRLGLHVLVGSALHRGPHRVRAWLPSLVHYCFLDDPRTKRVYAEPNQLNTKMIAVSFSSPESIFFPFSEIKLMSFLLGMIQYFESVGFVRHGDVVFPHKTAALMICERTHFYEKCPF